MIIKNIIWDTDGISIDDLPETVELPDGTDPDEVSDILSDEYGWCVESFSIEKSKEQKDFEQKCYEAYKLDWMLSHGYTMRDYLNALIEADEDAAFEGEYPEGDTSDIFESLDSDFEERGFGSGSIWVCKNEFLGAEFKDREYMSHLFSVMPDSKKMREYWVKTYGWHPEAAALEVPTSAGVLRAYRSTDPGQPGIVVMLQPAGYEEEIDVSYVSVYEDADYQTSMKERPVDVVIMTYADATNEDYTSKDIIRREEVIAGLGTGGKE